MSEVTMAQVADKALDKSSVIIEKAAAAANDIFSATAGIVTRGIEQYGPQVIDAVLWVVRIDAIQSLIYGWFAFIIVVASWIWIWTGFTRRNWYKRGGYDGFNTIFPSSIWVTFSLIFTGFFSVPRIMDVWLYTAVAKPELYLVKKTVDMVEKKLNAPEQKKQ
jgi:hypothetical protein